ncbi:MAG TPA: NADH-quinone oxidoreductase subunit G, partial [Chloroflexi bacterium]|nr:NADH-quinone oxidoreductase subunit G [Chloroflexota bacterium]
GVEEMFALKQLIASLGSGHMDCRPAMSAIDPGLDRAAYIFNPGIAGIEDADAVLIIGSNPRKEASLLNARIRKSWRANGMAIGVIGDNADLPYDYDYLGDDFAALQAIADGSSKFAKKFKKAKRPIILVGEGAISQSKAGKAAGRDVLALATQIAKEYGALSAEWNGFGVLHNGAARVGGLDIGFVPQEGGVCSADQIGLCAAGEIELMFLLGADEYDMSALGDAFCVYIGTHGDAGAHRADVILPAATYTEKSATYVNTEGRVQMTTRAVFPPGEAKEDWSIIRALSAHLKKTLPFDSLNELRAALYAEHPHLARLDVVEQGSVEALSKLAKPVKRSRNVDFSSPINDFYLTNPICRASAVMGECASLVSGELKAAE